jgi:hypothetical protein
MIVSNELGRRWKSESYYTLICMEELREVSARVELFDRHKYGAGETVNTGCERGDISSDRWTLLGRFQSRLSARPLAIMNETFILFLYTPVRLRDITTSFTFFPILIFDAV